ncbi:hypothetical protein [Flavobacterium suzhouense]|uniref:Uncharacterized protein n=1 Tax=Flavobacterium suzhouense TaxID=1529638 RepID=A0ABW5NSQ1_9FLAO
MKPWVKTGLFYAIWMFVFMTFVAPYILVWTGFQDENEPKFLIGKILINAVFWLIFGLIFGYWNGKKKNGPKKQIDS